MKTLYVTDLDGTLLDKTGSVSDTTLRALEELYERGVLVSPATGRSHNTLGVLRGARFCAPYVLLNGSRIWDAQTQRVLSEHIFRQEDACYMLSALKAAGLSPYLYTQNVQDEQCIYYERTSDENALAYARAQLKKGDDRFHMVERFEEKLQEKKFFITVRGEVSLLQRLLGDFLARGLHAYLYYGVQLKGICFLECAPATKAQGVEELRRITGAERVVAFGDNGNDEKLLQAADVRIAVENATEGLKAQAHRIIGANNTNSVVKTIYEMEGLTWNF